MVLQTCTVAWRNCMFNLYLNFRLLMYYFFFWIGKKKDDCGVWNREGSLFFFFSWIFWHCLWWGYWSIHIVDSQWKSMITYILFIHFNLRKCESVTCHTTAIQLHFQDRPLLLFFLIFHCQLVYSCTPKMGTVWHISMRLLRDWMDRKPAVLINSHLKGLFHFTYMLRLLIFLDNMFFVP